MKALGSLLFVGRRQGMSGITPDVEVKPILRVSPSSADAISKT
jgi:hypothetical protein